MHSSQTIRDHCREKTQVVIHRFFTKEVHVDFDFTDKFMQEKTPLLPLLSGRRWLPNTKERRHQHGDTRQASKNKLQKWRNATRLL
jgi:hypothetical protein